MFRFAQPNVTDMDFSFNTIAEFNKAFKTEKACYLYLEKARWNGKPVCPHCGSTRTPSIVASRSKLFKDIPSYRCNESLCNLNFTVRTGGIFEGSKIPLMKWFQAAYEISISKKGISSVELGERIGISQKAAWHLNHRLRVMFQQTAPEKLDGIVEMDETYIGGKRANKPKKVRMQKDKMAHYAADGKAPVFGMLDRDGELVTKAVDRVNTKEIYPIIADAVEHGTTVVTDGHTIYKKLANEINQFHHEVVNHEHDEYVRGIYHTNGIEGFWGLLKRGIIGTFHFVSPQHLQRYCDEFTYRYNMRQSSAGYRFNDSMKHFDTPRLTYKQLTSGGKA